MEVKELEGLLDSYNKRARLVKDRLMNLYLAITKRGIPTQKMLRDFNDDMDSLISAYNQIREIAKSELVADEMPKDGCKASEYVDAILNSKSRLARKQMERAKSVLKRFLKVESHTANYEEALSPYKDKASKVLREIEDGSIDEKNPEIVAAELFLKSLDMDDINGQDGFRIMEQLKEHYSRQVQWGIMGRQYFIGDENVSANEPETDENRDIRNNYGIGRIEPVDESELQAEEANENLGEEIEDCTGITQATESEEPQETESTANILIATNRVKNSSPSASSFKKEIVRLAKFNREIRSILPMLTNLGVLSRDLVFVIGICMDVFEESDRDREKVEIAIDTLIEKGYIANFEYVSNGATEEALCLSSYCHGCLAKDSISTQMKGFWDLSFGDVKVVSSGELEKGIVDNFIHNNRMLADYLYAAKGILEENEYFKVKLSIKWEGDHYQVAVVQEREKILCYLCDSDEVPDKFEEQGILFVGEEEDVEDSIKEKCERIFLFHDQEVELLGEPAAPVVDEISKEDDSEEALPLISDENGNNSEELKADEDNTIKYLMEKKTAPTDSEFCGMMLYLLNRKATTKEQLNSIITQTACFAKAVADVALDKNGSLPYDYSESYKLSAQIRLASCLMLNECAYSSEFMSSVFTDVTNEDPALMLSSYLFAMLIPSRAYDYMLENQTKLFLEHYEEYFNDFAEFKPLFNKLMGVREISETGFSPAFVSLLGDEAESENFINGLRKSAQECRDVKIPWTRMKGIPKMYTACFGPNSELQECMEIICDNRRDEVELVEAVLSEYCDEQSGEWRLSDEKVEEKLEQAWYDANAKKFKLEYDARDQALRQFTMRLEIMQSWVECINNKNNRKQDISRLKNLRAEIFQLIQRIQKDSLWKKHKNANILAWALSYIQQYLSGQAENLKIYAGFLYTGIFSVGSDGIPIVDCELAQIKYYEPWRNVLAHVITPKKQFPEIKAEILGDNLDEMADEEGLKDNLHQLEMIGKLLGDDDEDYVVTNEQLSAAEESANDRAMRFQEKLELAYTYNQIRENEKERLLDIANQYKQSFYEARDFACWRRFLDALEKQMAEFAMGIKKQLRERLDSQLDGNLESPLLKEADRLLEGKEMNFAVAEEYMNRFDSGEKELNKEEILHEFDYFSEFLDKNVYDPLLRECRRCSGKLLSSFGWKYVEQNLPEGWTARQREGSKNLVTNWPKRKGASTTAQIKSLFEWLDFDVKGVKLTDTGKAEIFELTVAKTARGKSDYIHPIAAFGTQMRSPIHVIVLFGNHTPKELVDKVLSQDFGGISIVLLDRPVDAASRRMIGEIFHTQTSRQNPFLLIDQVLILYLAFHQITERMPAMLQCTLPYTSYQPFVRDGGSTADEMFCGRTKELETIINPNGACVVYGGRQLGKTALLERAESRCSKPEIGEIAVYTSIVHIKSEREVVEVIVSDINKKSNGKITIPKCTTLKEMCDEIGVLFRSGQVEKMLLLIDEVDDFLASIADDSYSSLQPLVDLKRETKNSFKFVIAGLHNVCRAKNATRDNGIFGQMGTPLCIRPLSPMDAMQLISKPLRYLGFQMDQQLHLETILTNTNYYPGILQFFGYMLVETLTSQYSKYYHAADGNPPFTLQDEQLGAVMNSSDLNKSIKDKFRWSLELDQRYFMLARCITMLYHLYEKDRKAGNWQGFSVEDIKMIAEDYDIHCLENESMRDYAILLDEMVDMGILSKPDESYAIYRLRRNSFVDIIGENIDTLEAEIISSNEEA